MGLDPEVFDSMTPAEFIYAQCGHTNRRITEFRQAWEIARFSTYNLLMAHRDPRKKPPSMTEMFPFGWDRPVEKKERKKLTSEERRERVRQILKK